MIPLLRPVKYFKRVSRPWNHSYAPHTKQQRGCFEGPFSAHQLTLMGCQPLSLPVSDICPNMICNPRRKSTQVEMFPRKKKRENVRDRKVQQAQHWNHVRHSCSKESASVVMTCTEYPGPCVFRPFNLSLSTPVKTSEEVFPPLSTSPSLIGLSVELVAKCQSHDIHSRKRNFILQLFSVYKPAWREAGQRRHHQQTIIVPSNSNLPVFSFLVGRLCVWQVVEKITVKAIELCLNWDARYFKILCFADRQKETNQTELWLFPGFILSAVAFSEEHWGLVLTVDLFW